MSVVLCFVVILQRGFILVEALRTQEFSRGFQVHVWTFSRVMY